MKEELQVKFRKEIEEKYQQRTFEAYCVNMFYSARVETTAKEIQGFNDRIAAIRTKIADIEKLPDRHSKANREAKNKLLADIKSFEKLMQPAIKLGQEMEAKAQEWYQEGLRNWAISKVASEFKLKTPDEIIAAEKKQKEIEAGVTTGKGELNEAEKNETGK